MDDFLKDPKKATLYYREESLRAMAAGEKTAVWYWRLAADAAKQVIRQGHGNSILLGVRMPFVHHFTELALSLQKVHYALENSSLKKNGDESFGKKVYQKICSHYQYWVHCLIVSCSHDFQREVQQILEAEKKYSLSFPKVADYLKQALHAFKMAQHYQQCRAEEELIVARWISAAYEAAHVANIFVQRKAVEEQNNSFLLESWEAMTKDAEQAFSLRIKAAEVHGEQRANEYSLAAFVMNEAVESKIQLMKVAISTNQFAILQSQVKSHFPDEIVEQRIAIATSVPSNLLLDDVASWLETAWEADLKRLEAVAQGYDLVASYWEESRNFSRKVANTYKEIALKKNNQSSFALWWHKIKLDNLENKAKKKIPIMFMEEVFFCMPENYFPNPNFREKWERGEFTHFVEHGTSLTMNAWLYQTGILLRQAGVKCHFYTKMPSLPSRGILITMSGFLYGYPKNLVLPPSLFMADIAADEGIPRSVAMLHLIPNRHTIKHVPFSEFIPHWSQPFLIPRSAERGDRFETICFMGSSQSIALELRSPELHVRLEQELGLRFIYRDFDCWHNFSDVDCIVAIREFSGKRFCYKPAHKLHNAWLAGVPFIGGIDSAYAGDGCPGEDYLVANSADEVFKHLKQLKTDIVFRTQLVERGRQAGAAFTREAILESWKRLVLEILPVRAQKWYQASPSKRFFVKLLQRWSCGVQSFIHKYYKPRKYKFVSGKKLDVFTWASQQEFGQ